MKPANRLKGKSCFLRSCILCVLFLSFCGFVRAQSDSIVSLNKSTEKILRKIDIRKTGKSGLNFWEDEFSGHWAGVDFGFNLFLNEEYSDYSSDFMNNDVLRSNSVHINFIQQSIGLQRNRNTIGLLTGIGVRFFSYRLNDDVSITLDENNIVQPQELDAATIKKSKLGLVSLMVPLLAEFQLPINNYRNRVYISGGIFGELKLNSHTKVKYKDEQNEKLKVVDHFSIRDFNYGIMLRTGYRGINLYATYNLLGFFIAGKGPELTPFSFGITLLRF